MATANPQNKYHHFLGIDVSKDTIDCLLRPSEAYSRWTNRPEGFGRLHRWLVSRQCDPAHTLICIEDTGIYSDRLLAGLTDRGWQCAVVKTTATKKVAPEHHRKEDRFDAGLLAEYGQRYVDRITLTQPPKQVVKQLQQLYAERQRLIKARGATQNRKQQGPHGLVDSELLAQQWQQQLQLYNKQIDSLESQIRNLIRCHSELNRYYQLLQSIPGVGQVTAWLWLILFYGQQQLNHKQIASRFGFAPHRFSSGSSVRGKTRSSGHGNSQMRSCMTMVARSVSHHHERFARYKQRKLNEGKPWPVVRNNLINKMIKIICAIWNSGQPYRQDYESRFDRQKNAA
jgi:transposase